MSALCMRRGHDVFWLRCLTLLCWLRLSFSRTAQAAAVHRDVKNQRNSNSGGAATAEFVSSAVSLSSINFVELFAPRANGTVRDLAEATSPGTSSIGEAAAAAVDVAADAGAGVRLEPVATSGATPPSDRSQRLMHQFCSSAVATHACTAMDRTLFADSQREVVAFAPRRVCFRADDDNVLGLELVEAQAVDTSDAGLTAIMVTGDNAPDGASEDGFLPDRAWVEQLSALLQRDVSQSHYATRSFVAL